MPLPTVKKEFESTQSLNGYRGDDFVASSKNRKERMRQYNRMLRSLVLTTFFHEFTCVKR